MLKNEIVNLPNSLQIGIDTAELQHQNEIDFRKFTNTLNKKNSELNEQMAKYADTLIAF